LASAARSTASVAAVISGPMPSPSSTKISIVALAMRPLLRGCGGTVYTERAVAATRDCAPPYGFCVTAGMA